MKKYLLIGLIILIGTNLVVLGGAAYNRQSDATAQLTLTEREISLPYDNGVRDENSGISLSINWRTPTRVNESYYPYNSRDVRITESELLALGFDQVDVKDNYWVESRELYWAFEFDGALHKAEVKKATEKYQAALAAYEEQPNEANSHKKDESSKSLDREEVTSSRLFFINASADYESLAATFSDQQNILIVKGLAKPYYNSHDKYYSLKLKHLLVSSIMVPLEYAEIFTGLKRMGGREVEIPRYVVDVKWGSRLEPWIVDVEGLAY